MVETTAGRVIFNEVIPEEIGFINEVIDRKSSAVWSTPCTVGLVPQALQKC